MAPTGSRSNAALVAVAVAGFGLLLYAYGTTLAAVAGRWSNNAIYSHGYLVPLFALVLLWLRRKHMPTRVGAGTWWGVPVLAAAVLLHLGGAYWYYDWFSEASLLPALAGLTLCLGGWPALRWAGPSILFLAFMLPLPYSLEVALALPLQKGATAASTYVLQTLGVAAFAEGNTIVIDDVTLEVAAACNGLGMMVTFFALATAVALVIKRPWLDRLVLVASALPVALVANIIRIVGTALVAQVAGARLVDLIFHDLAGWLMMPLALGLLAVELWVLSRLLLEVPADGAVKTGLPGMMFAGPSRR